MRARDERVIEESARVCRYISARLISGPARFFRASAWQRLLLIMPQGSSSSASCLAVKHGFKTNQLGCPVVLV